MAVSGTIGATTFNANKIADLAYRRCRIAPSMITAEMQTFALDNLYLWLSDLANARPPSWCIEKIVAPMYQGQPAVSLPAGTAGVLNLNYRVTQTADPDVTATATSYTADLLSSLQISTVGVKWSAASVNLTFQVSADGITWITVGTQTTSAVSGEWTWTDLSVTNAYQYFRITSASTISYSQIALAYNPQEIPLGPINRDTFSAQSNKAFQSRPTNYWFQRDREIPRINLWPSPNADSELHQLVVWRHRHVMDTTTLQQEVEVPQHWVEAMVAGLAAKLAAETPLVDINMLGMLDQKAAIALQKAWEGDGDSSPTFIRPNIRGYTR